MRIAMRRLLFEWLGTLWILLTLPVVPAAPVKSRSGNLFVQARRLAAVRQLILHGIQEACIQERPRVTSRKFSSL